MFKDIQSAEGFKQILHSLNEASVHQFVLSVGEAKTAIVIEKKEAYVRSLDPRPDFIAKPLLRANQFNVNDVFHRDATFKGVEIFSPISAEQAFQEIEAVRIAAQSQKKDQPTYLNKQGMFAKSKNPEDAASAVLTQKKR